MVSAERKTVVVRHFGKDRLVMTWILKLSCGHTVYVNVSVRSMYYDVQPKTRGCYHCKDKS